MLIRFTNCKQSSAFQLLGKAEAKQHGLHWLTYTVNIICISLHFLCTANDPACTFTSRSGATPASNSQCPDPSGWHGCHWHRYSPVAAFKRSGVTGTNEEPKRSKMNMLVLKCNKYQQIQNRWHVVIHQYQGSSKITSFEFN